MNKYVKAYHFFTKNRNKIDTQSRADAYIRKKSKKQCFFLFLKFFLKPLFWAKKPQKTQKTQKTKKK
jgi:hypothetical protein